MKLCSTNNYLVLLFHDMLTNLDKPGKLFSLAMYDFSKSFDLIDHSIVIQRLYELGLRSTLLRWFCSFFSGRLQRLWGPSGKLSQWSRTTCGVPQGVVCGPVAFLAMINDADRDSHTRPKYVDDLTIYEVCPLEKVSSSTLQQATQNLHTWASESNMALNIQKCQFM